MSALSSITNGEAGSAVRSALNSMFTEIYSGNVVALTDAATITTDAGSIPFGTFTVTVGATGRTLANPTNLISGGSYVWIISQDGTGSRTITTYGNLFTWPGGTVPTLSTAASAVDVLSAVYDGTKLRAVLTKAYA